MAVYLTFERTFSQLFDSITRQRLRNGIRNEVHVARVSFIGYSVDGASDGRLVSYLSFVNAADASSSSSSLVPVDFSVAPVSFEVADVHSVCARVQWGIWWRRSIDTSSAAVGRVAWLIASNIAGTGPFLVVAFECNSCRTDAHSSLTRVDACLDWYTCTRTENKRIVHSRIRSWRWSWERSCWW